LVLNVLVEPDRFLNRITFLAHQRSNFMTTTGIGASNSENASAGAERKVYEVMEFVSLKPDQALVSVAHYRTVYFPDGKIQREDLAGVKLLQGIIKSFSGYSSESAGTLMGFFDDPKNAEDCAKAITLNTKATVEVCGTQLVINP
jgi:hypothetical protein